MPWRSTFSENRDQTTLPTEGCLLVLPQQPRVINAFTYDRLAPRSYKRQFQPHPEWFLRQAKSEGHTTIFQSLEISYMSVKSLIQPTDRVPPLPHQHLTIQIRRDIPAANATYMQHNIRISVEKDSLTILMPRHYFKFFNTPRLRSRCPSRILPCTFLVSSMLTNSLFELI